MTKKVNRERFSIRANPRLWKELKIYCAQNDITISEVIEKLVEKKLGAIREA